MIDTSPIDPPLFDELPDERFGVIYCDPPWTYDRPNLHGAMTTCDVGFQYPTVKTEVLKELPVADIAEDDCLMFMWAVSPKLDEAIDLGRAWGFQYSTVAFVWNKLRTIGGNYTLPQTEMCLVFKRGRIPQPRGARNVRQYLEEVTTVHSRKPDEVRRRIDAMFPHHRKIELFARRRAQGQDWEVWGNESDNPDTPELF